MVVSRSRPRVGDEAWEVEWCSKLAFYPGTTDVDRDACTEKRRLFSTRTSALSYAKEVWPHTVKTFGIVSITPIRFVAYDDNDAETNPHAGFWEHTADSEILSDDSGIPE